MLSTTHPRRVLLVSYLFPPIGGGGVQRALKMARYLPQFQWHPTVLTAHEHAYHATPDPSLLQQLPGETEILRAGHPDLRRWLSRPSRTSEDSGHQEPGRRTGWKSLLADMLRAARDRYLLPDEQIVWLPSALWSAWRSHQKRPYDAIVSTSGPYTNHLVALYLHRWTGLPWVADFRDPWSQNMHRPTDPWRRQVEEDLEAQVVRECDCLTTVTQGFADQFRARYGGQIKRLHIIYNGYDPEDWQAVYPRTVPDKLSFLYAGILYGKRSPAVFLKALRRCLDEGWVDGHRVIAQFAGVFDYPGHDDHRRLVKQLQLEEQVQLLGNLPHREVLQRQAGAGVLLLIGDHSPDAGAYIPGKLFEYMAARRPILALQREGEASRLIREHGLGIVVEPDDPDEAARAIAEYYQQWLAGALKLPPATPENLRTFHRREQARQMANILDELCRAAHPV